jgi:ribonuclease III
VVTDFIFRSYPDLPEGELAKVRASVVSAAALSEVAAELDLGNYLLLGKGEDSSGGREKPSILADALEAVLGCVYIKAGLEPARDLVLRLLGERITEASEGPGGQDYKTRLQELTARHFTDTPHYSLSDEGPDHAKRFFAEVFIAGEMQGRGQGRSKKQAEAAAARAAWTMLRERLDGIVPGVTRVPVRPPAGSYPGVVDAAPEPANGVATKAPEGLAEAVDELVAGVAEVVPAEPTGGVAAGTGPPGLPVDPAPAAVPTGGEPPPADA